MKVITDSWHQSAPKFGTITPTAFDYRVFLQDEKWLLDGVYSDLATMTPEELFRALEGLFCHAERHHKGMIQWYQNEYQQILGNDLVSGSNLLGFLVDFQNVVTKNPHDWLKTSLLIQGIERCLERKSN